MSWQERGVYMGLLFHQFDKGNLPTDVTELARIAGMEPEPFASLWRAKLANKFIEHAGRLYNIVMSQEWSAQAEYLLRNRERGRKGGKARGSSKDADDDPFE